MAALPREAAAAALILALSTASAQATGTLSCNARDANVDFAAQAVISRGMGEGWGNFVGELEIRAKGVPASLARHRFTAEHLAHSWQYRNDFRLRIYSETSEGDAFRSVELVAQNGRYTLTAFASDDPSGRKTPRVYRGRIRCSGDETE